MNQVPNSKEAEMAVIGSVLLNPACFREIDLAPDDFYYGFAKSVWSAFQKIAHEHKDIDYLTVTEKAPEAQQYLIDATTATPSSLNWESYVSIVKDKAKRRRYIQIAADLATVAYNETKNLDEELPAIITKMVGGASGNKESEPVSNILSTLYDEIQVRISDPKEIYGLQTGIAGLDKITGGLQKGEIFLLSGEPGLGKSLLAMQIGFSMAKFNKGGVIYEMEMSKHQTLRRTLSAASGVFVSSMKSGKLEDSEHTKITEAIGRLEQLPVYFSDSTSWTTASIRADLVKRKTLNNIEWFVVDYLRLLKDRYGKDDHERLAYIGTSLHDIAKDLNLAGLVIHSMNKQGIAGNAGMASLSGSGQISYDVDSIAVLQKDSKNPNLVTLMFDKLREGDGDARMITLLKKPGFPYFGEVTKGQYER